MNRTISHDAHTREVWDEATGTSTIYIDDVASASRPLTAAEAASLVDPVDRRVRTDLHARARQALVDNAAFLAVASPTNAQTLAQVRKLTRQTNALIRMVLAVDGARDLLVESSDV